MKTVKIVLLISIFIFGSGCSAVKLLDKFAGVEEEIAKRYGSKSILEKDNKTAPVDLISFLDPDDKRKEKEKQEQKDEETNKKNKEKENKKNELDLAFHAFYEYEGGDKTKLAPRRNRVQDRLILASNDRSKEYKKVLKTQQDTVALLPALISIVAAGAGAIFTPASTVRALSGSSAIVSGMRAESLQTLYAEKSVHIITKAMDIRRKRILDQINIDRKENDLGKYTVERAISDVVEYHSACSLVGGIEEVQDALDTVDSPGLDTINDFLIKYQSTQKNMKEIERITREQDTDKPEVPKPGNEGTQP